MAKCRRSAMAIEAKTMGMGLLAAFMSTMPVVVDAQVMPIGGEFRVNTFTPYAAG